MIVSTTRMDPCGIGVLIDAKRFWLQPRSEIAVWTDLIRTAWAFRSPRRRDVPPSTSAKVVLVVLVRDDIFETKTFLLQALALRQRGWRVVVLAQSRRSTRALRYARALGVDEIVVRSELVRQIGSSSADRASIAEKLLKPVTTAGALKQVTFKGSDVGRHVFASTARETLEGTPDPTNHTVRPIVRRLMAEAVTSVELAELIESRIRPNIILLEEANYAASGPLVDVLVERGANVVQSAPMFTNDGFISKRLSRGRRNLHPASVEPDTFNRIVAEGEPPRLDEILDEEIQRRYNGYYTLQAQNQPSQRVPNRSQFLDFMGLSGRRPIGVIFAHVLWDASLFFGSDLFDDYAVWFVETVQSAIANDRVDWIVRSHPSNVFRVSHGDITGEAAEIILLRSQFPALPGHVKVLTPEADISSLALYQHADFGVTVRGTAGLEMATFGKPVITAGTGHYMNQGFTIDSDTRDQYKLRLAAAHELAPLPASQTRLARLHALTVFNRRVLRSTTFPPIYAFKNKGFHTLDRNIDTTSTRVTNTTITEATDLMEFADWVESGETDFLSPPLLDRTPYSTAFRG